MARRGRKGAKTKRVNPVNIQENKLFKVLNHKPTKPVKSKQSNGKPNQLSVRLGEVEPTKKAIPPRPELSLQSLENRYPVKSNALARALNVTLPHESRGSSVRSSYNNKKDTKTRLYGERMVKIDERDRHSRPFTTTNFNENQYKYQNRHLKISNTQNKNKTNSDHISFRNASLIPFLRIENLTSDVTESDIRTVLSAKLGPIIRILKMNTSRDESSTVTAEVFFVDDDKLPEYASKLDKINADGRILSAKIAYNSLIINSDKLWDAILKEVRVLKQQYITNNL